MRDKRVTMRQIFSGLTVTGGLLLFVALFTAIASDGTFRTASRILSHAL